MNNFYIAKCMKIHGSDLRAECIGDRDMYLAAIVTSFGTSS